jgi:hypothetical protein
VSKRTKKPSKKLKTTTKTYEIMRVDWKDHFSGNKMWGLVDDLDTTPKHCVTVGMKVHEDKETITLCQNMSQSVVVADTTTIIKSCILKTKTLGAITYERKA